ncbi:initiation factor eif gamma [Echinococcus multilocularis]|uniref:Initiation factor eif gamma n=1 Tax=Echinococcus multilocularis TaxID=6211 RepID=A0A068YAJ6_ECHMU|nr:initiation factor eif gamma [Echinococcus multilocularis]
MCDFDSVLVVVNKNSCQMFIFWFRSQKQFRVVPLGVTSMSNTYQYSDNRNGYPQTPDQQQYMSQMNAMPFMYFPAPMPYLQTAPIYSQQLYSQSSAQMPPMAHPQAQMQTFNQSVVPAAVPQQQIISTPTVSHNPPPPRKTLEIKDPKSGELLDFGKLKSEKRTNSETSSSVPAEPSVPVKIRTPPPKDLKILPDPKSNVSTDVIPPQTIDTVPENKPDFSLNSEEEIASNKDSHETDDSKQEIPLESDATSTDTSANDIDVDAQELSQDSKDKESSAAEDQPIDGSPQCNKRIERVGSDSSGNIQKYNREQLISIRSATDFSNYPSPPMSVVTAFGGNSQRHKGRAGLRPQSRRVLTFNTETVVLDEVENAYKPSHLKKAEDIPADRLSQLSRDLNVILNRLIHENVLGVVDDVKKSGIKGEDEVNCLVNAITNKATRQALYSEAFAKLCKALSEADIDGFRERLIKATGDLFSTPLEVHIDNVKARIDEKIRETNDEKVKKMLEEDRETVITKKREAFFGIMRFFSFLYLHDVIPPKVFTDALRPFAKPKSQDDVLALLTCLDICGETMDARKVFLINSCISGLENARKVLKMEQYVQYKIIALVELRQKNWKKSESVPPPQTTTLPRSNSSRDSLVRRVQTHNVPRKVSSTVKPTTGKMGDSKTPIDTKNLAVSSFGSRSNYLGPQFDWSQGSKAQPRQPKSGTASESDNGRESRASSVSTIKRETSQSSQFKIDEALTAKEAIRDAIDAFMNSDTPKFDLLLRESEKKEFVREILCRALEGKADERRMFVNILSHLYSKRQLNDGQMEYGFAQSLEFIDEVDCPKLGVFFGELLSSMVISSPVDLTQIVKLIDMLPGEKYKREALAQCIKFAADRIGEREVAVSANKTLTEGLPWGSEKAFTESSFLKLYHIEFITTTLPPSASASASVNSVKQWREATPRASSSTGDPSVSDLIDKCLQQMDLKELVSICSQNSKSKDAEQYLRKIFAHGRGLQRKEIDSLVPVVKIFIHPTPDSERLLVFTLQKSVDNKEVFKAWLQSLVQQKLLTPQSLSAYAQDKRTPTAYKDVAVQILRKCRQ